MRKKILLPVGLAAFVLLLLAVNSIMSFKKEVPLNLTDRLQIHFEGENGSGSASAEKDIEYDGLNETVHKFIDSVSYTITPSTGLSNGDLVTVKANYDDDLRKLGSISLEDVERQYIVEGLLTVSSEDGENVFIDGYEIPASMSTSEEDRRLYLEYIKSLETPKEESEIPGLWSYGENPDEKLRENKKFLISDYNDYKNDAMDRATEYGRSSSQAYQVRPVVKDNQVIGWETIFK